MEYPFVVGQKVVCVNDEDKDKTYSKYFTYYNIAMPTKGEIYTIREVFSTSIGNVGVRLVEIVNPVTPFKNGTGEVHMEMGYMASRFRPVVEKKTDISIFKEMLNRSPRAARKHIRELVDV